MSPDVIKQLMAAMKQFRPLVKDKNNPFFKSTYADLPQVYDVVKGPLQEHGFILLQGTGHWPDNGGAYIKTQLLHVSGEEFSSTYDLPPGLDAQKMAAAVTYGKRVALCALLALAADDDDDGEAAEGRNHRAAPRQEAPKHVPAPPRPAPAHTHEPLVAVDPSTPEDKVKADAFLDEAQKIVSAVQPDIPADANVMLVQVVGFNPNPRPAGKGTSYSLKILDLDGGGEEEWTSTFNKEAWETGKLLKGQNAHLTYKRKGQYLNFYHIKKAV